MATGGPPQPAGPSQCALARARGLAAPLPRALFGVRSQVRRFLRQQDLERSQPGHLVCKRRWLYYRGDDNYGLGNVLYDVASAAALAMVLNRSVVYGLNASDRKFGSLLRWPGIPTLDEVEASRRRARCGAMDARRQVVLAPDRCTFHKRWRQERTHLRPPPRDQVGLLVHLRHERFGLEEDLPLKAVGPPRAVHRRAAA